MIDNLEMFVYCFELAISMILYFVLLLFLVDYSYLLIDLKLNRLITVLIIKRNFIFEKNIFGFSKKIANQVRFLYTYEIKKLHLAGFSKKVRFSKKITFKFIFAFNIRFKRLI